MGGVDGSHYQRSLLLHLQRRRVEMMVRMVQGAPKTEASAKDVPLDAALAESLLKLRLTAPYNRETDWVFASPTMKGKQPLWPETLWRRYGRPAVKAAKIQKRVGFHTFRHTYTTLLTQNNEDEGGTGAPTSCQQSHNAGSLRSGGNAEQATGTKQTRSDRTQQGRSTGLTGQNWTMTQIANSLQVLERIGGDDGTRTRGLCRDRVAGQCN